MQPPLARTVAEAYLYMELHPCVCDDAEFEMTSSLSEADGAWLVRYEGACETCGSPRAFVFRQPDELVVPGEGQWAVGDQPSELLDAGEWLRVCDIYSGSLADPATLSAAERSDWRADLVAAAAALDEVLKFLPPGVSAVPESAFWSAVGRSVHSAEPGRFRRDRLEAARGLYRRTLEAVEGATP